MSPILWILALSELAALLVLAFISLTLSTRRWQPTPMSNRKRAMLLAMTVTSLVLCVFAVLLEAGYGGDIVGTRDSTGNELGWNLPLTWELCRAMLENATWDAATDHLGWFGGLFLCMHLVIAALLAGADRIGPRASAAIAWVQLVLFPTGWLGVVVLPFLTLEFLHGDVTPEALCEPPLWWTFQPLWFLTAILAGMGWFKASQGRHGDTEG